MRDPKCWVRNSGFAVVVVVAACAAPDDPVGSRFADERATSPAISPVAAPRIEGDESMAALTAEVRQLRVAVEELARSQRETQALGVYFSAQQSRVLQATQLLDAARKDLESAIARSRDSQARLAALSDELPRTTDRAQRAALEDGIRAIQADSNGAELELQQARAREDDLSRALAREEDRWSDLLSRLERLTQ